MTDYYFSLPIELRTETAHHQLRANGAQAAGATKTVVEQVEFVGNLHGCRRASWSWHSAPYPEIGRVELSGLVSGPRSTARHAVEQWASALKLTASRRGMRGTVDYEGEIDGLRIRVWAVVDEAQFKDPLRRNAIQTAIGCLCGLGAITAGVLAYRRGVFSHLLKAPGR